MSTPDFYSLIDEPESSESSTDFYSLVNDHKPQRNKAEKAARLGVQYGIGATELAALPYEMAIAPLSSKHAQHAELRKEIFSDIERLEEQKQTGIWDQQDENLLSDLISKAKSPEASEKFVKTANIGVADLAEKVSKELGYDISPEDLSEHIARLGGNVVSPKNIAKLPKLLKSLVNNETREGLRIAKESAKLSAKWDKLASVASKSPEKQTLLNFAKEHGLSPEASNLLMHSDGTADYLAKIGRKTKRFKGPVQELKDKLGKNYEELKEFGKTGGYLNFEESEGLTEDLGKILIEMSSSPVIGPDVKPVITTLEETIQNIHNKPNTIKELINARQGLAQSINWRSVDQGDVYLQQGRKAFLDAITKKNPEIGNRLLNTDRAWGKYERFKNVLEKKIPTMKFKGIEVPSGILEVLAFASPVIPFIPFGKALATTAILKNAIQRVTTEVAVNPKFQKPLQSLQKAMIQGNPAKQKQSWLLLKKTMKQEDPDLYKEIKDLDMD